MGKYTQKNPYTNDDGVVRSEHMTVSKKSDDGNTRTYHGSGGSDGSHGTEHADGEWYSND